MPSAPNCIIESTGVPQPSIAGGVPIAIENGSKIRKPKTAATPVANTITGTQIMRSMSLTPILEPPIAPEDPWRCVLRTAFLGA